MGTIIAKRTAKIKKDRKGKRKPLAKSSRHKINFVTLTKKEVEDNRSSAYDYVL